jgi:hypothetical protein
VASLLISTPINMGFTRRLVGDKWDSWVHLCRRLMEVRLNDGADSFIWNLTRSGSFTVKSMYADLINGHTRFLRKYL